MNRLILSLGLLVLSACASSPRITTDHNPSTDFGQIRTYSWLGLPEGVSPLAQQRIVSAVDAQLQAKGWQKVEEGEVVVAANVATRQKQTVDTFYNAPMYAGWGWRSPWLYGPGMGMGTATTTVHTYDVGTLVVDLFMRADHQAIWRGTAEGSVPSSPQKGQELLQKAIDGMFADFPPGGATP